MRKALALAAAGTTITGGLLAVAATANAATVVPQRPAPTALSVRVSAPVFRGHGSITISGELSQGRKPLAGEVVTLDVVRGRRLVPAESARTNRGGGVAFAVSPRATTTYELSFGGARTLAGSDSGAVTVRVVK